MKDELERRTRYDPAEAEAGVRTRWLESGSQAPAHSPKRAAAAVAAII